MAPTLLRYCFCECRFVRGYPIFPCVLCFNVRRLCRIRRFVLVGRFALIGRLIRVWGFIRVWGLILIRGLFNRRRCNSGRHLPAEGGLSQGRGCLKIEGLEAVYLNRRGNRLKGNKVTKR